MLGELIKAASEKQFVKACYELQTDDSYGTYSVCRWGSCQYASSQNIYDTLCQLEEYIEEKKMSESEMFLVNSLSTEVEHSPRAEETTSFQIVKQFIERFLGIRIRDRHLSVETFAHELKKRAREYLYEVQDEEKNDIEDYIGKYDFETMEECAKFAYDSDWGGDLWGFADWVSDIVFTKDQVFKYEDERYEINTGVLCYLIQGTGYITDEKYYHDWST